MKIVSTFTTGIAMLGCTTLFAADDDIGRDEAAQLAEAGTIKSLDELDEIVLELHPGTTIEDTELEREASRYVYQVELRGESSSDGEWDVALDASSGEVISDIRDN